MNAVDRLNNLLTPQRKRYPWFIGGALWLGWLLSVLLGEGNLDLAGHLFGTDYSAFYTAGKILLSGQEEKLYDLEWTHAIQQELYGTASDNFNPYLNPPHYAWIFIPFARLPYLAGAALWMAVGLVGLWTSLKLLGLERPWRPFLLILTWLPAFSVTSFGQNAYLSLFLLCLVYWLWKKDYLYASGLTASLLLYKPQLVTGLGLIWLLEGRRNWKALLGLGSGGVSLILLSYLLLPKASQEYLRYSTTVVGNLMTFSAFPIWNAHATQTFWIGLFPENVNLAKYLYIITALFGLAAFLRFWQRHSTDQDLLFASAICLTVWITPYLMIYDWVLLLIPAVILWQHTPALRRNWRLLFAFLWVVMFFSSVLTYLQTRLLPFSVQVSVPALMIVLVYAYQWLRETKITA